MSHFNTFLTRSALAAGLALGASQAMAEDDVMVVFDGSNSMWGQIDGTAKIEIARSVMDKLLGEWTADRQVGLMAYGHRRRGDCTDIETLIAPSHGTTDSILKRINAITPTGKTPLTAAVEMAAKELAYTDRPATVVLISDGLESCDRDPCALARALEKGGVGFTAHVVGFGLTNDEDAASLACIAEETGGEYISASNASELGQALSAVSTAVAAAPTPLPAPEPEPEPEPLLPQVALSGPETAVAGSAFPIGWSRVVEENDYITILPVGTREGTYDNYLTVKSELDGDLQAPSEAGLYELRYVHNATSETLGRMNIEIVEPVVTVSAPETAIVGADIPIEWTGAVHPNDYITVVPVGADDGTYGRYVVVRDNVKGDLQGPAAPGLYEIRYLLNEDARTVYTHNMEIVEADVTLNTPETAVTGQAFEVSWTGAPNRHDYITIVPMGTDEGEYGNYIQVRDNAKDDLTAPSATGLYEVRYVLREDARTVARKQIEITDASVTLVVPDTALTGERFDISWDGAVSRSDYITIVPMGTDEGVYGNYIQVRKVTEGTLQAPSETGLYEVRYVLREGDKTLARAPIEITEPEVTISAPDSVTAGQKFDVSWTGAVDPNDYITIVPLGTDEGTYGNYVRVRAESRKELLVPTETGLYELRYVLAEGATTIARRPIEVIEPEVTMTVPATALAGQKFEVSWTGAVNINDYITIVPMGSDEGTYENYFRVRKHAAKDLQAPANTGLYEVRYVLAEGVRTLARETIEITEPEITLTAPAEIRAGDKLRVSWTGAVDSGDYIALVPVGSDDSIFGDYFRVRTLAEKDIKAPDGTGLYELRYILKEGGRVMVRHTVEVLSADAALDSGASLVAPETAASGSIIEVRWTAPASDGDQRITLAKTDQAIFTWITAIKIKDATSVQMPMPDAPGNYELRFLDVSNQAVLARKVITVE